ncbi:hypothetical protein ACWEVP_02920 [Amycolatopsis sp. NPDC003865]
MHRPIVAADVEGFGARQRTDADRLDVRNGMHRALREAFGTAGVEFSSCHVDCGGDGVLVLVLPDVPNAMLVDLLPRALADALVRHNEAAGPARLKQFRAIATRFDKAVTSYRGMIEPAALLIWL